ncbi:MAG TPA: hypothetical protein VMM60_04545 [Ilumatobacter sp.]|nr:hypothetical protein [Ilumatobacter sp.]
MLGKFGSFRHVAVGTVIAAAGVLGATGLIGGGHHDEVIDHWQVVISPAGGDAVRVREVFDQDFGSNDRHGPERTIPHDFGEPVDVSASSPDAPDDLDVDDMGFETRIRVGDPDVEVSGQHRYVIEYMLPEVELDDGVFRIDAISDKYRIDMREAEVILNGFDLSDTECFTGPFGSTDECELVQMSDRQYRVVVAPLESETPITVGGVINGRGETAAVPLPPLPERRGGTNSGLIGLGLAGLSAATVVPIYVRSKRKGRNEVFAGGAADAAFGELPAPGTTLPARSSADAGRATVLVADDELADLATIEFVPPPGIQPWEAAVLLSERIDASTTQAYFSGLVGREVLAVEKSDGNLAISSGPKRSTASPEEASVVDSILVLDDPYITGKYDPAFAAAWSSISAKQRERIAASGWWKHGGPGASLSRGGAAGCGGFTGIFVIAIVGVTTMGGSVGSAFGLLRRLPVAIIAVLALSALVAFGAYSAMLPARSAQGSALALRTESFRRFLHASEGQHVEWAWNNNLLREYSAWAVALGEAEAWSRALERANVPEPARLSATPLIVYSSMSSINSSHTAPSTSSSSSGGGSGGGFSGGGGGGGGGGSW